MCVVCVHIYTSGGIYICTSGGTHIKHLDVVILLAQWRTYLDFPVYILNQGSYQVLLLFSLLFLHLIKLTFNWISKASYLFR